MRHIGRDSLESIGPALEHSTGILPVAYSPDGKSFISTTDTGVLAYWDFGGSQFRWMGQHRSRINCVVFNQQGTAVMTGSADGIELRRVAIINHLLGCGGAPMASSALDEGKQT